MVRVPSNQTTRLILKPITDTIMREALGDIMGMGKRSRVSQRLAQMGRLRGFFKRRQWQIVRKQKTSNIEGKGC